MYKITLFDDTSASCTSFPISVYCSDLEQFEREWLQLETDPERMDRFRRSKAGELVTDFHPTDHDQELNIVQWDPDAEILSEYGFVASNQVVEVRNSYDWPSTYYVDQMRIQLLYVRFQGKLLKLASFRLQGICTAGFYDGTYKEVSCYGNKFLKYQTCGQPMAEAKAVFQYDWVESFVFYEIGNFETMEDLQADLEQMKEHGLSEEELNLLLKDLPGEAG